MVAPVQHEVAADVLEAAAAEVPQQHPESLEIQFRVPGPLEDQVALKGAFPQGAAEEGLRTPAIRRPKQLESGESGH